MSENYLLDTNIVLETIWGKEPVASRVASWIKRGQIVLSPIVVAEIYAKGSQEEKEKLELLIGKFGVLPIDVVTARIAGDYRHRFLRKKKKVFLMDCLIAAAAKLYGLTLVTHNTSDYPMTDINILDPR